MMMINYNFARSRFVSYMRLDHNHNLPRTRSASPSYSSQIVYTLPQVLLYRVLVH